MKIVLSDKEQQVIKEILTSIPSLKIPNEHPMVQKSYTKDATIYFLNEEYITAYLINIKNLVIGSVGLVMAFGSVFENFANACNAVEEKLAKTKISRGED